MIDIIGSIIKILQNIFFIKHILPTNIYDIVSYEENEKTYLGKINVILLHVILILILLLIIIVGLKVKNTVRSTVKYFTGKGLTNNNTFSLGTSLSPINY
jgi:hypothetical protein